MSTLRLCLFMLCLPSLAMAQAGSLFPDEAPAVARLLDDGLAAQALGSEAGAEARFCAAARLGSVEGQYRLGRFYLETGRPARARPLLEHSFEGRRQAFGADAADTRESRELLDRARAAGDKE